MSTRLHRRQFLQATSALVASLHAPLLNAGTATSTSETSPRLLHIKLQVGKLEELRHFYQRKLGLTITTDTGAGFALKTGPSTIQFTPAPPKTEPFYHFAFNIPESQFAQAKAWLARRTPLLLDSSTGKDEVYFASWNAHAVYFRDPAGNIGELIARHTLKNEAKGTFSEQSLLCVSEIGLVTDDAKSLGNDLSSKLAWPKAGNEMAFIGDGMGYLIVAPIGRPWLPDRIQKAVIAPVEVMVNQALTKPLQWAKQPYTVSGVK